MLRRRSLRSSLCVKCQCLIPGRVSVSLDPLKIVPTLCVGMPQWTLCVRFGRDAERPGLHSHAERGNDQ
ncbi:hypothetical protein F6R97_19255 [Pseudomonas sp. JV414]|nr:hypothetical protein [Pseudomonas sp. JV414]